MDRVIVSIAGGGALGGTYALVALGIVLAFRATGTFNFAHGQFMLFPAFLVGAWQAQHRASLGVSITVGLLVISGIGLAFYLVVLQRTVGMLHFMGVIATFGLAAVLDGVMLIVFGSPQYNINFPGLPQGVVHLLGTRVSAASLVVTAFTLLLAALVAAGLRFTPLGIRIRAAGQDAILASQGGLNVRVIYMGSWALAACLAGIAGIAYGTTNLTNSSLVDVALAAFPAILIGGLDSIEGAVIGGLLVGIAQGFIATFLGSQYLDVLTYGLLLVVMLVFPTGLLGTRTVTRV
jgi:branched-chain amino acid transport system permease protein